MSISRLITMPKLGSNHTVELDVNRPFTSKIHAKSAELLPSSYRIGPGEE